MASCCRVACLIVATALAAAVVYITVRALRSPVSIGPEPTGDAVLQLVCELGFGGSEGLEDWSEVSFNGHSQYSLETDEQGETFLAASSDDANSGIFRQIKVPMGDRPHLSWQWRVKKFPSNKSGTSLVEKSDCDFAARVCVVFAGDSPFTSHYIHYVWDDRFPEGAHADSSGALNRTKVLVVEDSAGGEGSDWVSETRDVIGDYRMLFGKDPKRAFVSVGILTDSDGTHTDSAAEFRNIRISTVAAANAPGRATGSDPPR